MANKTIAELFELTSLASNDLIPVYDVSEVGPEKITKITTSNFFNGYATDAELTAVSGALQSQIGGLDTNYATDAELTIVSGVLQTNINDKSDLEHTHDGRYFTETELTNGQLDGRYYTETEVDTISGALNNKIGNTGEISQFATTVPTDWLQLFKPGDSVSRTTYSNLFTKIGTTYGNGDGSTTFGLPSLSSVIPFFVNGTSLPEACNFTTISLLSDGRILVIGGSSDGKPARSETYFGTIAGNAITWVSGTAIPAVRYAHTASVLSDGRILVTGGGDGEGTARAETYFGTIAGNAITWVSGTSLISARYAHTASVLSDGRILVTGGNDGSIIRTEAYFGTIAGNAITWVSGTSLIAARYAHTASVLSDGRILVTGGYNAVVKSETYFGTISTNTITWVSGTPLLAVRYLHTASVLSNGRVLIIGGSDGAARSETYFGTIAGNAITWVSGTAIPAVRYAPATSVLSDGRILVTGGHDGVEVRAETYFGPIPCWGIKY